MTRIEIHSVFSDNYRTIVFFVVFLIMELCGPVFRIINM